MDLRNLLRPAGILVSVVSSPDIYTHHDRHSRIGNESGVYSNVPGRASRAGGRGWGRDLGRYSNRADGRCVISRQVGGRGVESFSDCNKLEPLCAPRGAPG